MVPLTPLLGAADAALDAHRLQFAFTATFHYLFPQLTMGLALVIVILEAMWLRTGDERLRAATRFWGKIFAVNFAIGVVTGIPLEFEFGTNWSRFSAATGGVIGQPLAMEGVFSFFLESSVLGLVLAGERALGPRLHFVATVLLWFGTWLSGFFIVATNAWMQHPVAHRVAAGGRIELASFAGLFANPWLGWQFAHTMLGSVVTASFVVGSVGAFYLLARRDEEHGRSFVRLGVLVGLPAAVLSAFPTGDGHVKAVAREQPVTFAAFEGVFHTQRGAGLVLIGQPDTERMRLDNPLEVPNVLSFLTYKRFTAEVKGLEEFPREDWPTNVPLVYYSYHIMVGLGTIFIATLAAAALLLARGRLHRSRGMLYVLMLMAPFPYIANTAGWLTAELGRQPWLVYGVMRTDAGHSAHVSAGNAYFTLLGFMGLDAVLALLFVFLVGRAIHAGPDAALAGHGHGEGH
ncbi:MAG TPA: cytochrome ubiquinol oxidase subunit I [Planctomycetota bacterium]|nr:cytochrome ubiquinol oxidase subunit I [Planctomycetota bacterium]